MKISCIVVALTGVLTFSAPPAELLEPLTLERAIQIAIENHPRLAEAQAQIDAARALAEAAGKLPNPEAIARIESAPAGSGTASRAEYVGGLSQTLPVGGRLSAARKAEEATASMRTKEWELARFELARNVRNAFATALYSAEVVQIQTNTANHLRELIRITQARVAAGDVAALDLSRIQAEEAQHRLEVKEGERLHHAAMDALGFAMGDFQTRIVALSGSLADIFQIAAIRAEIASATHPAIAASQSEVGAQEARLRLARRERVPDVNLDLLYRRLQASDENAFDAGVRIAIPIFGREKRMRVAENELRASEARAKRIRNEIEHEQHELEFQLEYSIQAAELLHNEILPKVNQALAGAEARFKAGELALSDLLLVRRETASVRLRYAETLRSVMLAWSGLDRRH